MPRMRTYTTYERIYIIIYTQKIPLERTTSSGELRHGSKNFARAALYARATLLL